MTLQRGLRTLRTAMIAVLGTGLLAAPVAAEELLATRLGELLGQERQSIGIVPSARLSALTAPPRADAADTVVAPSGFAYDEGYLASVPAASGGDQWQCLAEALYFEARGESVRGMFAVGEVILNRVESSSFPGSVCGVVHQGTGRRYACQFTYTCDGNAETIHEPAAWVRVGKVARLLLDGAPRDLTSGATHYHTRAVSPRWARSFPQTAAIGSHLFYRQPTRTASN
ncbi:cell wall hydrolase [Loktanella sp. IMCC34160]|nr:cell wall hydrolase [Loktanella sp. IMCC34160]